MNRRKENSHWVGAVHVPLCVLKLFLDVFLIEDEVPTLLSLKYMLKTSWTYP